MSDDRWAVMVGQRSAISPPSPVKHARQLKGRMLAKLGFFFFLIINKCKCVFVNKL